MIQEHAPHVTAFAVSGYFGTRNPAHEIAIKRLVARLTGVHATCGHELTHRLHAMRRATTVALNARLIPLITDLIDAVKRTMAEKGIDAPLMVVKGDGSLIESAVAQERPIETILSGPAASVVGARHLSGDGDSVVVDMGGTTTDIAVITQGQPALSAQGARVGRWRTMVEAIGVRTVGLGGDSRVWLDDEGEIRLGPRRVVPVCLLAAEHPGVRSLLSEQLARSKSEPTDGQFLLLQRQDWGHDGEHPAFEADLIDALRRGPCPLDQVEQIMRHPRLYVRYLERLERQGMLIRAAFTPTDAAHVLRQYLDWDEEAARLAAQLLARRLDFEVAVLCRRIIARASERIAGEVVAELLADEGSDGHHDALDACLIARALRPSSEASVACSLTVRPTLVAIGAPVRTYFPAVSILLHSTLRIPEHTEVANAIGAIVGSVVQRVHVLIIPQEDEGSFRVHFPDGVMDFQGLAEALEYGEKRGSLMAVERARRAGAEDVRVQVARHDQSAPVATGWGEELYLRTILEVTATGRPRLAGR